MPRGAVMWRKLMSGMNRVARAFGYAEGAP